MAAAAKERTYFQDIGLAILKGEPLSRFQIEQHVENARRHFTASIFWESLGRLLALKLVVEDDDGIRANWEGDLEGSIEKLDSSAPKTPEKKTAFDYSYLHKHVQATRSKGSKVKCIVCGTKTSYSCKICKVHVCGGADGCRSGD